MNKRLERCLLCALLSFAFALCVPTARYWFDAQIVAGDHAPEFKKDNPAASLAMLIPHQELLAQLDKEHFTAVEQQQEVTANAIAYAEHAISVRDQPQAYAASMYQLFDAMSVLRDGREMTPLFAGRYLYPFIAGMLLCALASFGVWLNRSAMPKAELSM